MLGYTSGVANEQSLDDPSILGSIDPDQELSREDFNSLFGHIPNVALVKSAKGTYTIRGFLWYYWDDPRFRFDAENIDSLKWDFFALSDRLWIPEIEFDNSSGEVRRWGEIRR